MERQNWNFNEVKDLSGQGRLAVKPKTMPQPPRYSEGQGSITTDRKWEAFDGYKFKKQKNIWDFLGFSAKELAAIGLKYSSKVVCVKCNSEARTVRNIFHCKTCGQPHLEMTANKKCARCGNGPLDAGKIIKCEKCQEMSAPGYEKMNDGGEVRVADIVPRGDALDKFFGGWPDGYQWIYIHAGLAVAAFAIALFAFPYSIYVAALAALFAGRFYGLYLVSNYFTIDYNKGRPVLVTQ